MEEPKTLAEFVKLHGDLSYRERHIAQIATNEECDACAKMCDAFAEQAMKATHETTDKDAANSFRGQRIAAANLAGQIRNRRA